SGSADEPLIVVGGKAQVSRSEAQDVNAPLLGGPYASDGPVTTLYAGFSVQFTDLPSAGGSYFAHLGTSNMRGRIWASTANAESGKFRLGVGNSSSSTASSAQVVTDLSLQTEYTVVLRYELATGLS